MSRNPTIFVDMTGAQQLKSTNKQVFMYSATKYKIINQNMDRYVWFSRQFKFRFFTSNIMQTLHMYLHLHDIVLVYINKAVSGTSESKQLTF